MLRYVAITVTAKHDEGHEVVTEQLEPGVTLNYLRPDMVYEKGFDPLDKGFKAESEEVTRSSTSGWKCCPPTRSRWSRSSTTPKPASRSEGTDGRPTAPHRSARQAGRPTVRGQTGARGQTRGTGQAGRQTGRHDLRRFGVETDPDTKTPFGSDPDAVERSRRTFDTDGLW